ncbi:hypothetical protein PG997_008029 [Apiospora hydei]|uniref:Uncharacterized protein n=1 Tax=Apiospora hydei TaxID=1337664 RepID=A0ABR1WCG9_9PEZI
MAFTDTTTNGKSTTFGSSRTTTFGFNLNFELTPPPINNPAAVVAAAETLIRRHVPRDPQAGGGGGGGAAAPSVPWQTKANYGISASTAWAFTESYERSMARTLGYTDTSGTIATTSRPHNDSMKYCGRFYAVPHYQGDLSGQAYNIVWAVMSCQNKQLMGPEYQSDMLNQAIVWDDWAPWLKRRKLDSDLTVTLEGLNPHRGGWFGFEVRNVVEPPKDDGKQ